MKRIALWLMVLLALPAVAQKIASTNSQGPAGSVVGRGGEKMWLYVPTDTNGYLLVSGLGGGGGGGGGTVTSVALTVPTWLTVAGSPITGSGTLAVTATTGQTSGRVIGTCDTATTFAPCSLVLSDLPTAVVSGLSGDVVAGASSGANVVAASVRRINGVALSSLPTGPLCNTISTGVPSGCTNVLVTGQGGFGTNLYSGEVAVTAASAVTFNLAGGNTFDLTLTGDTTSTTTGAPASGSSQDLNFYICSAGHNFTWPSNFVDFTPLATSGCTSFRGFYDSASGNVIGDAHNALTCVAVASGGTAACGSATGGFVAIAAATNPVLIIGTTAIATNSKVFFTPVSSSAVATQLGITCNTTIPTGVEETARTAGTSVTLEAVGTFTSNPVCLEYVVSN